MMTSNIQFIFLLLLSSFCLVGCAAPSHVNNSHRIIYRDYQVERPCIMLDPGHGGDDFGTHSHLLPRFHEKSLNLATAQLVKQYLTDLGYRPVMTRTSDQFIPLDGRSNFANKMDAKLFVSIHYNSAPSKKAEGIEIYYYKSQSDKSRADQSLQFATGVLNKVIAETSAKSRGVKSGNFLVIRETTMPAILIECGFLTNDTEMVKIKDPLYMKRLAWAIAQGVDEFYKINKS